MSSLLDRAQKSKMFSHFRISSIFKQRKDASAELQKRTQEQSCLYRISHLDEKSLSIEALLTEATAILPEVWQYSEITAAAIEFDGNLYTSPNYAVTKWCMSAETELREDRPLKVKIMYLEKRPDRDEGPFLDEERKLIDTIIKQLSLKMDRILSQQELEEKEKLLNKAYQLARIGTWEFNMQTHELFWSPVTKEVHGFGSDYQPGLESTIDLFKEGENRDQFAKAAWDAINHEKPFDVELKIISGEGDERWIRATGEPDYNEDGICTRFYGISQNVSDRRQAEEDLQLSERRFKSLVQDGSDLIAILDSEANYMYVSPTSQSILGIPAEDFIGTNALDYIHEEDKAEISDLLAELSSNQRVRIPPYRFADSEGHWRWIETTLTNMMEDPAVGGLVANSRDVTTQIRQQQKNLDSLREKEILLAEIHHRVKNNLAVVSGMMQLQASEEENTDIKDRLLDGIVRIKTMANIHEQLYQSNSFSKLEFAENIRSLVTNIMRTFRSQTEVNIDFDCEPIQLNINQAIPCSLIVNEVVTNIFKHAFPYKQKGTIRIHLCRNCDDNRIRLSIKDDGVGLPENISLSDGSSLGLSLINVLSKQLESDYTYEAAEEGTIFSIEFDKDEQKGIGNNFL